ncbi:hypothetical protein Tco_0954092 [Tanacetum coccineum]|uniref:Uncharacterized protein n=1 Tax=Tanacetum coccineum TaxID=301880 RepID=A0ABQ5E3G3_9ASTR
MLQKCHGYGLTKGAIIQIFYHGLDEPTQGILDIAAGGIFLYKSPNQAFQFLDDKVLFELDWSSKSQNKHHQKSVAFADGSNNNDNSRLMKKLEALTIKMDSQFTSLKEYLEDMHKKYYDFKDKHAFKNCMNDDTPMCERQETNYIQSKVDFCIQKECFELCGCVPWKPSRDYNSSTQDTEGFKGLLHALNATVVPTKNIGIGIKLYEWASNLVAPELVLDHHLLDRSEHSLLVLRSSKYPKSKKNVLDEEEVLCQP